MRLHQHMTIGREIRWEWIGSRQNNTRITKETFFYAFFELVDLWTYTINPEEVINIL